jgi:hypothetical protein
LLVDVCPNLDVTVGSTPRRAHRTRRIKRLPWQTHAAVKPLLKRRKRCARLRRQHARSEQQRHQEKRTSHGWKRIHAAPTIATSSQTDMMCTP